MAMMKPPPAYATPIQLPFGQEEGKLPNQLQHLPNISPKETKEAVEKENTGKGVQERKVFFGSVALKKFLNVLGNLLMPMVATVAMLMLVYAGFSLITAQQQASEEMQKQKMNVVYTLLGLIVIGLAGDAVYKYIYFDQGNALLNLGTAKWLASEAAQEIKRVINLFLSFSGVGAILMLVISGIRLVLNPGTEDEIEKQKKVVGYTAVGIIIIGLADTLVNQIVFPKGGFEGPNVEAFNLQLRGLSNYILGFLGGFIFVSLVVSGVLMVVNQGDEEMWGKIKTTMKNILIGVTIVFSAYTIVATLINTLTTAGGGG